MDQQETNAQLSMLLKEKEYEVEEAKDKCRRLDAVNQQKEKVTVIDINLSCLH